MTQHLIRPGSLVSTSLFVALAGTVTLAGCAADPAELTFEEYRDLRAVSHDSEPGAYLIEEDIIVRDDDELYDAYIDFAARIEDARAAEQADEIGSTQEALVVATKSSGARKIWSATQRLDLTYCVDWAGFGAKAPFVQAAVTAAMADWADALDDNVVFRYVHENAFNCSKGVTDPITGATIKIAVIADLTNAESSCARATYPSSSGSYIEVDYANVNLSGGIDCAGTLRGYLRHEVGHTLGFKHEFAADDDGDPICNTPNTTGERLSPFDVFSSMTYPSCSGLNDYYISPMDQMYGLCVYDDEYAAANPICW
jgi:serralysin